MNFLMRTFKILFYHNYGSDVRYMYCHYCGEQKRNRMKCVRMSLLTFYCQPVSLNSKLLKLTQ